MLIQAPSTNFTSVSHEDKLQQRLLINHKPMVSEHMLASIIVEDKLRESLMCVFCEFKSEFEFECSGRLRLGNACL